MIFEWVKTSSVSGLEAASGLASTSVNDSKENVISSILSSKRPIGG